MQFIREKIEKLETELNTIKKNIEENYNRFDDLDSVKKTFIAGYRTRAKFDAIGWNENVVSGYVERTRDPEKSCDYVTLVIVTKSSLTIRIECKMCYTWSERELYETNISKPAENDFEKHLVSVISRPCPSFMSWFERIDLTKYDVKDNDSKN